MKGSEEQRARSLSILTIPQPYSPRFHSFILHLVSYPPISASGSEGTVVSEKSRWWEDMGEEGIRMRNELDHR